MPNAVVYLESRTRFELVFNNVQPRFILSLFRGLRSSNHGNKHCTGTCIPSWFDVLHNWRPLATVTSCSIMSHTWNWLAWNNWRVLSFHCKMFVMFYEDYYFETQRICGWNLSSTDVYSSLCFWLRLKSS